MAVGIVIDTLTKVYGSNTVAALDGLSLKVGGGEVYGFLGANGAGKSTTIRLLLNFLQPTSGSARINGLDIVSDSVRIKRRVGYLAGDVALYPKVTGDELLTYLSALQGKNTNQYRHQLSNRFEAELDKPIAQLSKGNRQKIGIIQAFMHRPDVLILDEPTSGLDPLMQEAFYKTVLEARDDGSAILMSSHNLNEAQHVCDRVGIIKHGKLIHEQSVTDDIAFGKPVFTVQFGPKANLANLKRVPGLKILEHTGQIVRLKPATTIAQALKSLSAYDIENLTSENASLEAEFLDFYGDSKA